MESRNLEYSKSQNILLISFLIAMSGSAIAIWGGSWDVTSHLLNIPDTFFTPSHLILYSGVGVSVISAVLGLGILFFKKEIRQNSVSLGVKMIIIGAVLQLIAGPGDFYWHEAFGIDGLLSPTHIVILLGMMMVALGSVIGITRMKIHFGGNVNFYKIILPVSFGVFWFISISFNFMFTLPISEGETHNFNPDPYVAVGLSFGLPLVGSMIFLSAVRFVGFGAGIISIISLVFLNITSDILTNELLYQYIPLYAAPIIASVIAEIIIKKRIRHSEKISGTIIGSMFFVYCFPLVTMTFLLFELSPDVLAYDVLHLYPNLVFQYWGITMVPGAIFGLVGSLLIKKMIRE